MEILWKHDLWPLIKVWILWWKYLEINNHIEKCSINNYTKYGWNIQANNIIIYTFLYKILKILPKLWPLTSLSPIKYGEKGLFFIVVHCGKGWRMYNTWVKRLVSSSYFIISQLPIEENDHSFRVEMQFWNLITSVCSWLRIKVTCWSNKIIKSLGKRL